MSMFEEAVAAGQQSVDTFAGQDAIYTRGEHALLIRVVPGAMSIGMDPSGDAVSETKSFDFHIESRWLVIDGSPIRPQRGDRITWRGVIYDVLPGNSDTAATESDTHEFSLEVHTSKRGPTRT